MTITGRNSDDIVLNGKDKRILIVHARWNKTIVDALVDGAHQTLRSIGVEEENIKFESVPGSWELPLAVRRRLPPYFTFDAIIAIGVLIKGETMHFEYIADAVSHGLMSVQLEARVPVVFGLLTVLNEEQGLARAGIAVGDKEAKEAKVHNHGEDWARAAVEMAR